MTNLRDWPGFVSLETIADQETAFLEGIRESLFREVSNRACALDGFVLVRNSPIEGQASAETVCIPKIWFGSECPTRFELLSAT